MKGTYYLPVTVSFRKDTVPVLHTETGDIPWSKAPHWLKSSPYYYYPYVFVSPFVTGLNTNREDDFPDAKYIVADSGGYQIGVQQKTDNKVSVLDVLRWQERIADVAFTVDVPSFSDPTQIKSDEHNPQSYRFYRDEYFERAMIKSVQNANKMMEAKENEKMKLWAVIQGGNYEDLNRWYKETTKEHTFDGYTFPMASTFTPRIKEDWLEQIRFARDLNTNFHFLGRCEPLLILIFAKLAQKTGKYYTYDTSTAAEGLKRGKYHDPYMQTSLSYTKKSSPVNFDLDGPNPCDCPVCSKHTVREMIGSEEGEEKYYFRRLYLHNVYVKKRYNDYVNVIVRDDEQFERLINQQLHMSQVYNKKKQLYLDKIKNIIYDEPLKMNRIESFF